MPRIKYINISNLIPTQPEILLEELKRIKSSSSKALPEVWNINNKFYIADGHHRIFNKFLQNNSIIPVLYFNINNSNCHPEMYEYLTEEILSQATKTQKQGVFYLENMQIN